MDGWWRGIHDARITAKPARTEAHPSIDTFVVCQVEGIGHVALESPGIWKWRGFWHSFVPCHAFGMALGRNPPMSFGNGIPLSFQDAINPNSVSSSSFWTAGNVFSPPFRSKRWTLFNRPISVWICFTFCERDPQQLFGFPCTPSLATVPCFLTRRRGSIVIMRCWVCGCHKLVVPMARSHGGYGLVCSACRV